MVQKSFSRPSEELMFLEHGRPRFSLRGPLQHYDLVASDGRDVAWAIQKNSVQRRLANRALLTAKTATPRVLYSQGGEYLGDRHSTRGNDVNVVMFDADSDPLAKESEWEILESALTTINLTHRHGTKLEDFLNRAHWVYGESAGGPAVVDHYAHAVNNVINKANFLYRGHKPFFDGTKGNRYYKSFAERRGNLSRLDGLTNVRHTIAATISVITGSTENPVGEAVQWRGGTAAEGIKRRHERRERRKEEPLYKDFTYLETGKGGKHKHVFFSYTEEGKRRLRERRAKKVP